MPRRTFLRTSITGLTALSASRVLGAKDDIRAAILGVRLRGSELIRDFQHVAGVHIVAICDADSEVLAQRQQALATAGTAVETATDFRRTQRRRPYFAYSTPRRRRTA